MTLNTATIVNKGYMQLVFQENKEKDRRKLLKYFNAKFTAEEKAAEQLECFTERLNSLFQQLKE